VALLSIQDVVVRFGGVVALDGPTFEVGAGEIRLQGDLVEAKAG
jgi:ABC-type branched-subunit amino acid transport system ATPase component